MRGVRYERWVDGGDGERICVREVLLGIDVDVKSLGEKRIHDVFLLDRRIHVIWVEVLPELLVPHIALCSHALVLELAGPQISEYPRKILLLVLWNLTPVVRRLKLLQLREHPRSRQRWLIELLHILRLELAPQRFLVLLQVHGACCLDALAPVIHGICPGQLSFTDMRPLHPCSCPCGCFVIIEAQLIAFSNVHRRFRRVRRVGSVRTQLPGVLQLVCDLALADGRVRI
ncbi:hypothetical protein B0H19DRAFT_1161196 [Mycena capillaripes]|nr:hypothetical protein B0H19DRAFT_1161196 [Mycena capillaripes]